MRQEIVHLNFAKGFRGGERQTLLLIEQLAARGYAQKLITRRDAELAGRSGHVPGLAVVRLRQPYALRAGVARGAALLHAHETRALQFAYYCHLVHRLPLIVTRRVDNRIKTNPVNRIMYAGAARAVALSRVIEREMMRVSPGARTAIIPSAFSGDPVDGAAAARIRARFPDRFLVGHVGALVDGHKGQSVLIDAARALEGMRPELHFLLLGRGEDEELLKARAVGLGNLTFAGFVDNVADYISCFDLFVFPSRHEGLGSILLDAMRLQVPIVASAVGGIPDLVTGGKDGVLVPPGDAIALQEAIVDLHAHPQKRQALAAAATATVARYSPAAMADAYARLYAEAGVPVRSAASNG